LGGFTTQNTDAEWSDSRQSQAGNVLLNYYRKTNNFEYLQRGIAALRAQFPVSPAENWAHEGFGERGHVTSFHWGTGSGMAGIEIEMEYLHSADAIFDVSAGSGVGVNGLNLTNCRVSGNNINFDISSPFKWLRDSKIIFANIEEDKIYKVIINGLIVGEYSGKVLISGINAPIRL
jgi:hypothetical protein